MVRKTFDWTSLRSTRNPSQQGIAHMYSSPVKYMTEPSEAVHCSFTNTAAMPIPVPMHMLVTKILAPVCLARL